MNLERFKVFAGMAWKSQLRLDELDVATSLLDLDLPANRFEALKGDGTGPYSVRIHDPWRICIALIS